MPDIKVAIVEDHAAMRDGLGMILNGSPGFTRTCAAQNADEALQRIPLNPPDAVLMDIDLPGKSGIECVRQLKLLLPATPIIMLTTEEDASRVFQSLEAGASGCPVRNLPPAEILAAIQEAHRGGGRCPARSPAWWSNRSIGGARRARRRRISLRVRRKLWA
jgi:DNA-binding NarL/FixJ family response regulator